ncbi:MAG: outer membrane beta-barrel protein [Bacteroidales bacterium]|nr:outer membrane beta-barrel protein [Candidatus Colimorpha pelethequi]
MKKVLLTIACVAFAFAANAQWVVSGNLGFTSHGGHCERTDVVGNTTTNYTLPGDNGAKTFALEIMPSIGYRINDNMQAGLGLGFGYYGGTEFDPITYALTDKEEWAKASYMQFKVAPYFRYYFAQAGKFSFFAEATLSLGFTSKGKVHEYRSAMNPLPEIDTTYTGDTKHFALGFSIVPGINYQLNDHFSVDCYIDLLSLNYQMTKATFYEEDEILGEKISHEEINVVNDFYFGVQALPKTINNHLGWFRLGLNYAF